MNTQEKSQASQSPAHEFKVDDYGNGPYVGVTIPLLGKSFVCQKSTDINAFAADKVEQHLAWVKEQENTVQVKPVKPVNSMTDREQELEFWRRVDNPTHADLQRWAEDCAAEFGGDPEDHYGCGPLWVPGNG